MAMRARGLCFLSWLGRPARALCSRPAPRSSGGTPKPHLSGVLAALLFASALGAQSTRSNDGKLDFGTAGLVFEPATVTPGHTDRTAQLLGEAYRRSEPLEWRRVRLIADLGQVSLPSAAPFVMDAMKDASPAVRAEAARSAAMITPPTPALLAEVDKLLADADANVRREAVLSAATLARALDAKTTAIDRGLADSQPQAVAAAIQSAWAPDHGKLIAQRLAKLPAPLQADAAAAVARTKSIEDAPSLLPLLGGDVAVRVSAVRALGELANPVALDALLKLLADPHPTVRRESITAIAKLDRDVARKPLAIPLLKDPDLTVREAATVVLTPIATGEALAAIAAQLPEDYAPLHKAARDAMSHPADDAMRQATIKTAVDLLGHADPRRREDGSYVLGRLRSADGLDKHLALLANDLSPSGNTDWALVEQAAESAGLIGDDRAVPPLMALVQAVPDGLMKAAPQQRLAAGAAMGKAMVALGRLGHRPALDEAVRLLSLNALSGNVPGPVRAGSAFVIGVLGERGTVPKGINFMNIYASPDESPDTKWESLKAMGNLRYAPAAEGLRQIAEAELSPPARGLAYWSYQRCTDSPAPFVPAIDRRMPPVAVSDLEQP